MFFCKPSKGFTEKFVSYTIIKFQFKLRKCVQIMIPCCYKYLKTDFFESGNIEVSWGPSLSVRVTTFLHGIRDEYLCLHEWHLLLLQLGKEEKSIPYAIPIGRVVVLNVSDSGACTYIRVITKECLKFIQRIGTGAQVEVWCHELCWLRPWLLRIFLLILVDQFLSRIL